MVSLKDIRKSNAAFKSSNQASGLVAVFVGATSGIGMGSLRQFAKYTTVPKIYILGRSKSAAAPLLDEIKTLNPEGTYHFIETEISLIKNVDKVCDEIKSNEKKIDLLYASPGYLAFGGQLDSEEGIDIPQSLRYYSHLRFIYNLLPLLKASPLPRVVSVLAGGQESVIDINDLEMKNNFSVTKAAGVALLPGMKVAEASVVKDGVGNGVYRLNADDQSAKESPLLTKYRADGVDKLVWESTQALWERVLARSA